MISLQQFINESLLTEGKVSFAEIPSANAKDSIKKKVLKDTQEKHPELDPSGFSWMELGGTVKLFHNGKKNKKKVKLVKKEGMSDWDYLKMVAKENKKFGTAFADAGEDEEDWKPLKIANKHDLHDAEDYEASFYINREGVIIVANPSDGNRCGIHKPYAKKDNRGVKRYFAVDLFKDGEHVN